MSKTKAALYRQIEEQLLQYGVPKEDAQISADVLVEGTSRGFKSHGVDRISQIIQGINQKTILPKSSYTILSDRPGMAVLNGNYGLGHPNAKKAMNLAIQKAKNVGIGCVGVINTSHIGILAYYSELAAKENCIGIAMTTSSPAVVIKGGKKKTFGTNPISYSIPHTPFPITADFSTSKVSRGKLYEYLNEKKDIPFGWAVDKEGRDTNNPKKALEGGLKTFDGDVKGDLISLLVSILAGNLLGGVINPLVTGTRYMDQKPNKGDFFMAFDINSFTSQNVFSKGIHELVGFISEQNAEFRIPGARAHMTRNNSINNINHTF